VRGGARRYVERMREKIADVRLSTPVHAVRRLGPDGVEVTSGAGPERFDDVVLACHSDQSLALLGADASSAERAVLGAIRYQANRAVLHTDARLLPTRRAAWAAWNYERSGAVDAVEPSVCLHYLLNRLQPLPFSTPVLVSLNPSREPRADCIHAEFDYAHPVFDAAAIAAQQRLSSLQGVGHTWFCGAWTRYGFHEDGLLSAHAVCDALEPLCATDSPARARLDAVAA
jgi:predicted NAD/FAD-binding protein